MVLLLGGLEGCATTTITQPEITPSPTQTQTIPVSPPFSGFLASAPCAIEKQLFAMKPTHQQDLESAGIDACYDLVLKIDPTSLLFTGTLKLAYLNDSNRPVNELAFRLYPNTSFNYGGSLSVNRAEIRGQEVSFETIFADQSGLQLPLPETLSHGDYQEISLEFSGKIPENATTYGIYNFDSDVETISLANGFPILAARNSDGWLLEEIHPFGDSVTSETSLFHVTIEMPAEWKITASGTGVNDKISAGKRVSEFVSGPMRDFMVVASPNFAVTELNTNDVTIRQWSLPENEDEQEMALDTASQSLTLFSQLYGDYPYNELDIVSIRLNNASGVEYPGLILMEQLLYPPDGRDVNRLVMVTAHEVAHQWWYGLVGNDVQNDPWQDEALATYASLVYMDSVNPDYASGARQFFQEAVAAFEDKNNNAFRIADPLGKFQNDPEAYSTIVYLKGALFMDALNKEVGSKIFDAALANFFTENQYQLADPETFLKSFENQCGCDLTSFYLEWGVRP